MELPIDIHSGKLLPWLISRRHCKDDWNRDIIKIREKINTALQDMPPIDEITKLLSGSYINYFHCKRIVQLLATSASDGQRNLFGQYSSNRMKDWKEIIALYEKESTFLGESSQLLQRNVNYEIPALKKNISRLQQSQSDCVRKQGDYLANAANMANKFKMKCAKIGIQGTNVKHELILMAKDMPETFAGVTNTCKSLKPALEHLQAFVKFTSGRYNDQSLELMSYIIEAGNTTVYEYTYKQAPSSIETIELESECDNDRTEETDEIDWGDDTDKIDFGDDTETEVIDWGIETDALQDTKSTQDGIARGNEALTLLDYTTTRDIFINQSMQIEAFLRCRLLDTKASATSTCNPLGGTEFEAITTETLQQWLQTVTKVIATLTDTHTVDLMHIRSSQKFTTNKCLKYVERLAEKLEKMHQESIKLKSRSNMMITKKENFLNEQKMLEEKYKIIKANSKILQKQIEGEISKKYKGRSVNIMGEINTI